MFKAFNSFQITVLFAAWPFGLEWLHSVAEFTGANALFWVGCVAYVIFTGIMTAAVDTAADSI